MISITVIILSVAIFSAMVINMALKPAYSARLTAILMLVAACGGSVIYGLGYTYVTQNIALSLVRTPFSVIGMYLGKNDLSAISGSPIVSTTLGIFCFWTLHLFAFYSIASAAMISVGAEGLRRLRLFLAMSGDLTIIYGINEESIDVGRECHALNGASVVFITETEPPGAASEIAGLGMAVLSGVTAAKSEEQALRKLRVRYRKKIDVYALDENSNDSLFYAIGLKDAFGKIGVDPKITSITVPGTEEIVTSMLQISPDTYGFGFVNVFDSTELAARAMIRLCPPWEFLTFDEKGRAEEDFDCIIIGSGKCGQAALRYLVMNGQFVGSRFHAAVFSVDYERESGYLLADCPELPNKYNIDFFENDARSSQFYRYLKNRIKTLKYIAVCTGDEEMNSEISDLLMLFLKRAHAENICVIQCTRDGVRYQEAVGSPILSKKVRSLEMLSAEMEDRDAILINSSYDNSDRTDWEKWVACDPFSKMSSRASAEFIPALIKASGSTPEEIKEKGWDLDEESMAVLGEMEHLRWCAFHFANGYSTMSEAEFLRNTEQYMHCREKGLPLPRITKNTEMRTHACLIPYDELDKLSERENAVTGKNTDYKQLDIDNVMMIPDILRARGRG